MADQQEDEDLKLALKMSMQPTPPEPKRSKPREGLGSGSPAGGLSDESPEAKSRRLQRELMAEAAEKRMLVTAKSSPSQSRAQASSPMAANRSAEVAQASCPMATNKSVEVVMKGDELGSVSRDLGRELSPEEANELFVIVFGGNVSKGILTQWTNQGIRFSPDPETSMGLVQHEGGPCGVLATLQAFVLKYLLFFRDDLGKSGPNMGLRRLSKGRCVAPNSFSSVSEEVKTRALVKSMCEILFTCGSNKHAIVATLSAIDANPEGSNDTEKDEANARALEGLSIESASDLQKILRVETFTNQATALKKLEGAIPVFQSGMGTLLFLISALLSRGLDSVQADRDDPILPLVTAPFGHASQEIVNLLLCGEAVANVFDGRVDLGDGISVKGVSKNVEVGFLALLESLNFCKVGQNLKRPKWPIWVVGSESHYTVLFALDTSVQDENEFEQRESQIRRAFDARDQSGGGGFISVEAFHRVVQETSVRLSPEKLDSLCASGFIVWSEFWQVILELDRQMGGLKDSTGMMGKKVFDLYHFNGIAKSDIIGGQAMIIEGEAPTQRPRLTKLRVSVPPKWTPDEFMAMPSVSSAAEKGSEVNQPEPSQHAPLVDCVRTRWPRAACNWVGDPPSIV